MKKNIGNKFALYPTPVIVVGAFVDGKPDFTPVFLPLGDPETVLLIDAWEDETALGFHHKSPMMKEIAALREKYHLKMRVQRFREI